MKGFFVIMKGNSIIRHRLVVLMLFSMGMSACKMTTSIRKSDKIAPDSANNLSWVQTTPFNAVNVTASWTVSTASDLANQKIQFYTGSSCNATSGALIDLASKVTNTKAFAGVDGTTYTYKIHSIDQKGNTKISNCSAPMVVDVTPPSFAVTGAPTWIYNGNKTAYTVTGTCTDATSGVSGTMTVTVTDGGGTNTGTGSCSAGAFSINVDTTASVMANGSNNISVSVTGSDAAGNSASSAIVTRSKDTTNPVVSLTPGSIPQWINLANQTAYTVAGTCSDADSGISGNVTVTVGDGTNTATATTACAAGAFSVNVDTTTATPAALAQGSLVITIDATVTDVAGNSRSVPFPLVRSKDTVAPTLTLTSGSIPNWVNVANKAAYPIVGTCSDATSGISGNVSVTISDGTNSKTVTTSCATYSGGTYTVDMTAGFAPGALAEGINNISITASVSDVATNSTTTASLTRSKDTVAPTVSSIIASTASGTYITGDPDLGFTITYSEAVTVSGAQFTLNTEPAAQTATCSNSTASTTQSCSYTMADGYGHADLDYSATNALTVTSFVDQANNTGVTTLPAVGGVSSIAGNGTLDVNPPQIRWEVIAGTVNTSFDYTPSTTTSINIDQTFILHNHKRGQTTSALGSATLGGSNPTAYSIVTDNCAGSTLSYNSSCTVVVRFKGATLLEGTYPASLSITAAVGGTATTSITGEVKCPGATGKTTYSSATAATTYTLPGGCTKIEMKAWGGGGSGGAMFFGTGGGGGFATALLGGFNPGDSVTVMVGGGGQTNGTGGTNGGGTGNVGGGGYSAVKNGATFILIAGAGGGGGWNNSNDGDGGAGGGSSGVDAEYSLAGSHGRGGTSAAGGVGGTTDAASCGAGISGTSGSYLQGGNGGTCDSLVGAPGGGGGYYGGGGGGGYAPGSTAYHGGGGGGSSYLNTGLGGISGAATVPGSGATPGNSVDGDRGSAGNGGATGTSGNDGAVVIIPSAT